MGTKITYPAIVIGEFSGNNSNGSMDWDCPITGKKLDMTGQFDYGKYYNENYWYHDVCDEDGNHLYSVIAK